MLEQENIGAARKIMHSFEVKGALIDIVNILIEEDQEHIECSSDLHNFEFFCHNRIFEIIWAYTKSDKPVEFFKVGIATIIKLIGNIQSNSLLTHWTIAPAISQLLEMIKTQILEFRSYHMMIIDFILIIMEKINKEPYIFDLMLAHANKKDDSKNSSKNEHSDNTFLPLKITLIILMHANPIDKTGLFEKSLNIIKMICQLKRQVVDEIVEPLSHKIGTIYQRLPKIITSTSYGGEELFDVRQQIEFSIKTNYIEDDLESSLRAYDNFKLYLKFIDHILFNLTEDYLVEHMISYLFNNFWIKNLQDRLLDNMNYEVTRTWTQYIIEILHHMKHPKITEMLFDFLFGFSAEDRSSLYSENSKQLD